MNRLPHLRADDILEELRDWMEIMRTFSPENFQLLRSPLNDAFNDIVNEEDLKDILTYSRVLQESYNAMNLVLPNTDASREYIASGATFIPVMLELISLGYELRKREEKEKRVSLDTDDSSVTH